MIWWIIYFIGCGFTAWVLFLASLFSNNSLHRNLPLNIVITVLWPITALFALWGWCWDR